MSKKPIIIKLLIVLALGAGVAAFAINYLQNNDPVEQQPSSDNKSIIVSGKVICLPPKDTTGPSDLSCAIGLEADDGKKYALNADDPVLTGGVPTGQRVKVTGDLTEKITRYDSVGTIKVESLQRL